MAGNEKQIFYISAKVIYNGNIRRDSKDDEDRNIEDDRRMG